MATLRKSRSGIITSKTSEYINKDIKDSEHYVGELYGDLTKTYEDEHVLTSKVEEFLKEIITNLTNRVTHSIISNRGNERDKAIADNDKNTFETQDKEFEKNIDEIFHFFEGFLEQLRMKVELTDKDQSEVARKTRIILEDCKNGIGDSYKINSKKMVDELEKAVKEYVESKTVPSNPGGEGR